ncbi:CAP domain-containing protein [Streptomyces antimicrobicus]|uniref:CAP domain-containing protein n=1 Tax=Streptomyces antimicrobicus TaxID=2883108 RepID=A0ABS8BF74_9ACTN|nr:CAP domain-containing protein [Streptomyces antimicrobicus]MCB5183289.1 CAP domain-containing protein [Streptomyces antimicrobicus]
MSRSRTAETPSRVEARRRKAVRTRIVLSVTAAAAAVAVGVAVADSDGDAARKDQRADAGSGTASRTAGSGDAPGTTATPAPGTPSAGASASASATPSGTPTTGASASATPTQPAASQDGGAAPKAAPAPADKPTRKPGASTSGGSGGSGGAGGSGGSGGSGGTADADTESAVLALVNKERAAAGCGPLATNAKLTAAARAYSDTMARSGVMSHTGPDGSTMTSRVEAAGYGWSRLGENIARGQADAQAVMNAWMNSSGHRANILNCAFKEIGIGVHKGDGGPWWTQNFGTPR